MFLTLMKKKYALWVQIRSDCSFWWTCWPSMLKMSFHNHNDERICLFVCLFVCYTFRLRIKMQLYRPESLDYYHRKSDQRSKYMQTIKTVVYSYGRDLLLPAPRCLVGSVLLIIWVFCVVFVFVVLCALCCQFL